MWRELRTMNNELLMSIENPTLAHFRHFSSLFTNFPSTTVESALQIAHFMQNKPNFRNAQMNVNMVLSKDYEDKTLGERGKNKPNSKPKQTQSNPIKANKMPKQSQNKAKQTQFQRKKMLLRLTFNGRRNSFGYYADKIEAPRAGACPPTVEPGGYEISHSTFCLSKDSQLFFIYLWLSAKIQVLDFQVTSRTIFGEFKL